MNISLRQSPINIANATSIRLRISKRTPARLVLIGFSSIRLERRLQPIPSVRCVPSLVATGYFEAETAGTAGIPAAEFLKYLDDAGVACPSAHVKFEQEDLSKGSEEAKILIASYATNLDARVGRCPGSTLRE